MILPGMGEIMVPAIFAAAPRRDHLRVTAFLNSWQLPSSHMLITCDTYIAIMQCSFPDSRQLPNNMLTTCTCFRSCKELLDVCQHVCEVL